MRRLIFFAGVAAFYLGLCFLHVRVAFAAAPPAYDGKPGIHAGQECVNLPDQAVMVWVPAGSFVMGSNDEEKVALIDEKPQHTVTLDGYWIYKNDVTVAQYQAYCQATGTAMPKDAPFWGWKKDHPMVMVTWTEARAYAQWAGGHLPSEAQWEKAARGTDGRSYPWGNAWDEDKCNTLQPYTTPVGSYPANASPYGCLDMAGNVWQWCEDRYRFDYYKTAPATNPTGAQTGDSHVMRGGSWKNGTPGYFRCACRNQIYFAYRLESLSFRCVILP